MLFNILLFGTCGYALWRGGTPERLCALTLIIGTLLTFAASPSSKFVSDGVDWGLFAVDVLVLAAFLAIALNANRFWPMWVSAVHSLAVLGHVSVAVAPTISPLFYATLALGSGWPLVILVGLGTFRHDQRVRAGYPDPDWTDFPRLTQRASA